MSEIQSNPRTKKKYYWYTSQCRQFNQPIMSFEDWYEFHLNRGIDPNKNRISWTHPDSYAKLRYARHKAQAKFRNIEWQFDFDSWYNTWLAAGYDRNTPSSEKGNERMCMCRIGDQGAYHPDNVFIGTLADNNTDAIRNGRKPGRPLGSKNRKK